MPYVRTYLRVLIRTIFDIQSEISEVDFLFYSGGGTNPHGGQW